MSHACAFMHTYHSRMRDVLLHAFCSCVMQDKDISQVLSSLAALAPSQDSTHGITYAPSAHSCMHAYMPTCLHANPQDRVSNIPETERIIKVEAKKRLEPSCMNARMFLFYMHEYMYKLTLAFSCLPLRPVQKKRKDPEQPEPSQPSQPSRWLRPPEPKNPPRPSAKQGKRTPPAPPPKPAVLPKPWWPPPPLPPVNAKESAKAPAAKSNPMDLGSMPKFMPKAFTSYAHSCIHVAFKKYVCFAEQAPDHPPPGHVDDSEHQIHNFIVACGHTLGPESC